MDFGHKQIFLKNHEYKLFKLYDPFLWMGFNCLKAMQLLQGDSILFTTRSQEGPQTHLIDLGLGRMKGWFNLEATQWFWTLDPAP